MKASILDHDTHAGLADPAFVAQPRERGHLVLVPTGPYADGHRPVGAPRPRSGPVGPQQVSGPPPMRLTPFGRLVVSVLAASVLALLLSMFAGSLASASGEAKEITVRAGQTLSGIAAEHLPELPVRDAVVELQILNGLSTSHIHVGQTLRLPTP